MSLRNPALWLSGRTDHAAVDYRMMLASLVRVPGAMAPGAMLVAPTGTPSMAVTVAAGAYTVAASGANQGQYHVYNDAPVTLSVGPAPATGQSRYDLVVLRVNDNGTGTSAAELLVVPGSPATTGSQVVPGVTGSNYVVLARILVGPVVTTIQLSALTDQRVAAVAANNMRYATEATKGTVVDGELVYATDTDRLYLGLVSGATNRWRWIPTEDEVGAGQVAFVSATSGTATGTNGSLVNTGLQTTYTFKANHRYRISARGVFTIGTAATLARLGISGVTLDAGKAPVGWEQVTAGQGCMLSFEGHYEPGASDVLATVGVTIQAGGSSTGATTPQGHFLAIDDVKRL